MDDSPELEHLAESDRLLAKTPSEIQLPTVLLVDDQPARLLTYEAVLEGVGVTCVRALSGQEALGRLLKQSFALIVLDVSMPDMDGFETARAIREHPRYEHTPIIFVTGVHLSELDRLRAYEVGAIDYIQIPLVPEILRSKVALLVELYKRRRQLEDLNHALQSTRTELEGERHRSTLARETSTLACRPVAHNARLKAVRRANDAIVDWEYVEADEQTMAFLGLSRTEAIGHLLSELMSAEQAADFSSRLAGVVGQSKPHHSVVVKAGQRYAMSFYPVGDCEVAYFAMDLAPFDNGEARAPWAGEPQEEREWLATLLDNLNEEVWFTDTSEKFIYANPAALGEFGYTSVKGLSVADFARDHKVLRADGTVRPIEEAPPLRSLRGEVIRAEEQMVRNRLTGELRTRQVSSAPVRGPSGNILGAVSVVRDVTEQRRVDVALRLRELRSRALLRLADTFRTLTNTADLAHVSAQILGETLSISRCGYGTIDRVAETITVERDWNAPGVSSIAGTHKFRDYGSYIEDLKRGDSVICPDARLDPRTSLSADRLEAISAAAFVNMPIIENGQMVALLYLNHAKPRDWTEEELVFVRDIAERTRIAVERRRHEQAMAADLAITTQLRELATREVSGNAANQLFDEILSSAMTIAKADCGTLQLLDDARQELHFAAFRGLQSAFVERFAQVGASSKSPCGVALSSRKRSFVEYNQPSADDPDGALRFHAQSGLHSGQSTPLISRSGRLLGMISTHWKQKPTITESELRYLDLLGRQTADLIERTQTEHALRISAEQMREADRRKDEFIAMLAHELRNPLVPIRTAIELFKKPNDSASVVETVRPMMERQVKHMVRLIDDLLDVSRITSGRIELRLQAVAVTSLVSGAVEANKDMLTQAAIGLTVNISHPELILNVDAIRFTQILSNLLDNAIKFTPPGGRISIVDSLERGTAGEPVFAIRVTDTGIGISEEALPKIFELFSPAQSAGRSQNTGLGIGLALARRLALMHKGTLQAQSRGTDQGSTFVLSVPIPDQPSGATVVQSDPNTLLTGFSVLVVDDTKDSADVIQMLIEAAGAHVQVAYDGASAVKLAQHTKPDVIVLDIGMPVMDGYETCQAIRALLQDQVAIIALTGWGQEEVKRKTLQAGFDAHITKPADPEELAQLIVKVKRLHQ